MQKWKQGIGSRQMVVVLLVISSVGTGAWAQTTRSQINGTPLRERINLDKGWRFMRYTGEADKLVYDERPIVSNRNDNIVADTRANESGVAAASDHVLKKWILPTANDFIKDPAQHHQRPTGNPGSDFPFCAKSFQ
ncbi:hypothetical protein [Paraflavitalea speifideaquila]|uniref:hypothetical protein n=1 Tax=Paraflavitalea speifideaquila TaxID=3076558 RepID=UPI0028ED68AD|nr:hypothetical protein [Paraflavitalea speifideiaquila]